MADIDTGQVVKLAECIRIELERQSDETGGNLYVTGPHGSLDGYTIDGGVDLIELAKAILRSCEEAPGPGP